MTRRVVLTSATVAALTVLVPVAHASPAQRRGVTQGPFTYTSPDGSSRQYWVHVPAAPAPPHGRALVVYLHGCNETARQTEQASHVDSIADANDFVVVYPQQTVTPNTSAPFADGNGVGCWNWFLPEDQARGSGEPALLAGLTQHVVDRYRVDRNRVYVEGVSAGADMAVVLGATYPDVYAAVAAVAGCAYATCADETGTLAYRAMGEHARVVPMFVENGTADTLNNLAMASGLVSGWLGTDDLADDGRMNGSVGRAPARVDDYAFDQTPQPGSGDFCVHANSFPCPGGVVGFRGSYPYTVMTYDDSRGCDVLDFWVVHGLEHAHPDAPGDGPYTDPLGPDVSQGSYRFFEEHPRNVECAP